jgi:hypothetical protein
LNKKINRKISETRFSKEQTKKKFKGINENKINHDKKKTHAHASFGQWRGISTGQYITASTKLET